MDRQDIFDRRIHSNFKAEGLGDYYTTSFNIEDVEDVHNVTLVGKGSSGVLNLEWIELPDEQLG